MFGLFKKPADPDVILLETHREVVEALQLQIAGMESDARDAERRLERERSQAIEKGRRVSELQDLCDHLRATLRKIADMETPGCAPAARRMARTARAELPEPQLAAA